MKTLTPSKRATAQRRRRTQRNSLAYAGGLLLGGIIPCLTYHVSHYQTQEHPYLWLAVAGGLAYSAPTVAEWFVRYAGLVKAWGFVVALEVAMTFTASITSLPALCALIALNALVLGNRLAND